MFGFELNWGLISQCLVNSIGVVQRFDVLERTGPRFMDKSLGKPFAAILETAGFEIWQKPFQNIRVTRGNERDGMSFKPHLIRLWIGHSQKLSENHFRTECEADYEAVLSQAQWSDSGQQVPVRGCSGQQEGTAES